MSVSQRCQTARQVVGDIVNDNGFVRKGSLELIQSNISAEARREIEYALLAKDLKVGSSVLACVSRQW
jgi:hypothetical protein